MATESGHATARTDDVYLGATVESAYREQRSVIGEVTSSIVGNIVLRVGREHDRPVHGSDRSGGWEQTEHVVLTPDEARELIAAMQRHLA